MSKREMTDSLERPGAFKDVKIVLVGPAKCGKTALIQRFVNDTFSDNYVPTGFEKYSTKGKLGDYTIEYSIWDTSGSGSYDTVRPLAYQDAQIFILCFSIADPDSLPLTIAKWLTEIRSHCPATPIILCGCKGDARQSHSSNYPDDTISFYMNQSVITREQALIACQQISGVGYVETCARYQNPGITEIFEMAAQQGLGISLSPTVNQTSKTSTKKRKTYSISTSTLGKSTSTSGGTMTSCLGNNKPQIKSDIRKSAKNCEIM